jgi:predicted RND superfamily exporter protein
VRSHRLDVQIHRPRIGVKSAVKPATGDSILASATTFICGAVTALVGAQFGAKALDGLLPVGDIFWAVLASLILVPVGLATVIRAWIES